MTEQPVQQATVALTGLIVAQASSSGPPGPLRLPIFGTVLTASGSRAYLGPALPANSVRIGLGRWPAGSYVLKTCARTDATGTPAALTVAVLVNMVQITSSPLYASGDSASASYPASSAWASYAAQCSFSLTAPSDVTLRWINPGTYHAAGKHLWIRAVQLHRTS